MKFASCDGCQLTLLDAEDELLPFMDLVHLSHFAEASSRLEDGPYDVTLVEGSILTEEDRHRIQELRTKSRFLVTIGACATGGGIQALRNFANHEDWIRTVYARPEYIQTLSTSTPISAHVPVDFELRGCPVDKQQLLEVVLSFARGFRPKTSTESVCQPCKRKGTVCVVVAQNLPCLGPSRKRDVDPFVPLMIADAMRALDQVRSRTHPALPSISFCLACLLANRGCFCEASMLPRLPLSKPVHL